LSHVIRIAPEPLLAAGGRLEVLAVPAGVDNVLWGLRCVETGALAWVDGPSAHEALQAYGRPPDLVLHTHHHGDHIGLTRALRAAGHAPRVIGPPPVAEALGDVEVVDEGSVVEVGAVRGRVLRTEGHLHGHVSFLFDDLLLCGDTMFGAGCGRAFHDVESLYDSLMRLGALPATTWVLPAHEYTWDGLRFAAWVEPENRVLQHRIDVLRPRWEAGETTLPTRLGDEQATNPFLRPGSPDLRARLAVLGVHIGAGASRDVFRALRAFKDTAPQRAWPDAIVPGRGDDPIA
jgi:hydroxyacylglutathione hydrolase